jgi:hypothetical protein
MKQRITIEQINELTDEQKQKLREWWKPQKGDCILYTDDEQEKVFFIGELKLWLESGIGADPYNPGDYEEYEIKYMVPLLSIGQMVELLIEHKRFYELAITYEPDYETSDPTPLPTWHMYMSSIASYKIDDLENGLCDGLWEAVKTVLK